MQFLNSPSDVQWLLDTHLKGVPGLPAFKSFTLQGSESSPTIVQLYESEDPLYKDKFTQVDFTHDSPIYCEVTPK